MEDTTILLAEALSTMTAISATALVVICILGFCLVHSMQQRKLIAERLNILCVFMEYIALHKDRLPRDVFHQYDLCYKESIRLMVKQGLLKPIDLNK